MAFCVQPEYVGNEGRYGFNVPELFANKSLGITFEVYMPIVHTVGTHIHL